MYVDKDKFIENINVIRQGLDVILLSTIVVLSFNEISGIVDIELMAFQEQLTDALNEIRYAMRSEDYDMAYLMVNMLPNEEISGIAQ